MNQNDISTHHTPSTHSNRITGVFFIVLQKEKVTWGKKFMKIEENQSKNI